MNPIPSDEERYYVVIDTNKYSGNFERPLVAFITGCVGDCGIGTEQSDIAEEELDDDVYQWFDHNVIYESDSHGCWRPATIYPSENYWNDGYGRHYHRSVPSNAPEVLANFEKYKERRKAEKEAYRGKPGYSDAYVDGCIADIDNSTVQKHNAYCSVAFRVYKPPTKEVFNIIQKRAADFPKRQREVYDPFDYELERVAVVHLVVSVDTTEVLSSDE